MNSPMGDPCSQVRSALGVYVLGAIDPAERSQVDAHLSRCPSCRDELAGMAGLPALLGRVSESQIADVEGPPEGLLDSLLAQAAAQRRSEQAEAEQAEAERARRARRASRRRRPVVAVAAAAVMLAGALLGGLVTGGLVTGGGDGPSRGAGTPVPHSASTPPQPSVVPAAYQVIATDPDTHVRARIGLDQKEWGTALTVRIDDAPPGARCHLYAVAKNGHRDIAAGWQVEAAGYGDFSGSTMITRDQLTSFEVVTTDGRTLVRVPVGA